MKYQKVQPQKTEIDSAGTVKISKQMLDKLIVFQADIFYLRQKHKLKTCPAALLGADENGVVQDMIVLTMGEKKERNDGCVFLPSVDFECVTNATVELVKKGLTPCGFLRVIPYANIELWGCDDTNPNSIITHRFAIQHGLDHLCGPGKLKAYTIHTYGMTIEQYADADCITANTYSYETV